MLRIRAVLVAIVVAALGLATSARAADHPRRARPADAAAALRGVAERPLRRARHGADGEKGAAAGRR
ncbi:hypothetical protein VSS74_24855 [Conexibacter stalactiti]|uniref:Uncharacterized protein n=1 Tax=Conexibacter stalactiti TaxID=1940611 RepID=A0ABU4HZW2_9ACTN|nr:hypothetical protein [Conexibacter stalactiti]MDW5597604.1 hypothetical protein [Conexibacter stalactiti]MEC5038246.1 hypothetical protein [Conexibacter stalactiti]